LILLDSSALVAALAGERAKWKVQQILRGKDAAIVSVNFAEVVDVLVRVFGNDLDAVEAVLIPLVATNLPVLAIGEAEARAGAEIRIRRYNRRSSPLSLADCLLLGTARVRGARIATTDQLLARAGHAEDLSVEALKS
jgi:predicted nucleic acid-binding protein